MAAILIYLCIFTCDVALSVSDCTLYCECVRVFTHVANSMQVFFFFVA